jgi:eukaryotic-like serine/threonine-protein kinase
MGATSMIKINDLIDERYRVINELGEGGFSYVYEVEDIITRKILALKILKDEVVKHDITLSRFEREARACASLNHPNIVRIVNVGLFDGKPYMASELIKGHTLKEELDIRRKYSFKEACTIMLQLCEAIAFAHSNLVVHRDIKPNNVYLTPDGTVKLGDFGIAYFENGRRVTKSEVIVGSVHYLAPEVSQGKIPTFQSDIYSLGITFFELCTGKVPYDGVNPIAIAMLHIKERFPSPRKVLPTVPKAIEKIIIKACRKNPVDRYRSVVELQKDIKRLLDNPKLTKPRHSIFARFFGFKMDD